MSTERRTKQLEVAAGRAFVFHTHQCLGSCGSGPGDPVSYDVNPVPVPTGQAEAAVFWISIR
jgi:hypothetical protein